MAGNAALWTGASSSAHSSAGESVASRRFTSHKLLLRTGDDAVAEAETDFNLGEREGKKKPLKIIDVRDARNRIPTGR